MTLKDQQRSVIRAKLLECLTSEKSASVRNKIGDAIAEVARQYSAEGKGYCARLELGLAGLPGC